MAKAKNSDRIYQLKITLRDVKPAIWRRLQVEDLSLTHLNDVIQTCMGWDGFHLHAFTIGRREYAPRGPHDMSDAADEGKMMLSRVVNGGFKKFNYTYDFGDNWRHTILVEKVVERAPDVRYPRCMTGRRACPPEDCGGPWGYGALLEALGDPKHERHKEVHEWVDEDFDPEAFDVDVVNVRFGA